MNKKAFAIALLTLLLGGGGAFIAIDMSTTINEGDDVDITDNSVVNNYILDNFGVDVNAFRDMCRNNEVPDSARVYCRLVGA